MHYLSLDTVIYRPAGLQDIVLCQYDDVMAELVSVKPSIQIQREGVIGSPWMHQAARGNASLQMTLTVVRGLGDVCPRPGMGVGPAGDSHPPPGGYGYLVVLLPPAAAVTHQDLPRHGGSRPASAAHQRSRLGTGRTAPRPPPGGYPAAGHRGQGMGGRPVIPHPDGRDILTTINS